MEYTKERADKARANQEHRETCTTRFCDRCALSYDDIDLLLPALKRIEELEKEHRPDTLQCPACQLLNGMKGRRI